MRPVLFRVIVVLQVMVILSVLTILTAGEQIIHRLNPSPTAVALQDAPVIAGPHH